MGWNCISDNERGRLALTILVIGEYYSTNLGDMLLCETVTKIIHDEFPNAKTIPFDLSGKKNINEYYYIPRVKKNVPRRIQKKLKKIHFYIRYRNYHKTKHRFDYLTYPLKQILKENKVDLAVFAGGEMFMDYFSEKIYTVMKQLKGINTVFHACGMYSLSEKSVALFREVISMSNVKSVSVRDSFNRFVELFDSKKISETFDTALLASEYYKASREKEFDYGIGVIDKEEYFSYQVEMVKRLLSSDLNWQLFTNGSESDYRMAEKILQEIGIPFEQYKRFLHARPCSECELVEEVTQYKYVIAFRMHCQIVAASYGIPSFGIVWDHKVKEFYDKLGLDNYSFPNQKFLLETIIKKLKRTNKEIPFIAKDLGYKSKASLIGNIKNAL